MQKYGDAFSKSSTITLFVVVSYKLKYEHEVLVNCLVKFAQGKVWLGELTVSTLPQLFSGS